MCVCERERERERERECVCVCVVCEGERERKEQTERHRERERAITYECSTVIVVSGSRHQYCARQYTCACGTKSRKLGLHIHNCLER